MDFLKNSQLPRSGQFRWHSLFLGLLLVCLLLVGVGVLFKIGGIGNWATPLLAISKTLLMAALLIAVYAVLTMMHGLLRAVHDNGAKLDNTAEMQVRQINLMAQISQGIRISDAAKEIIFRETEQLELGEAALAKLHQHDFDAAQSMITAMEQQEAYQELAGRLRKMAEKYRTATEDGRIQQIVSHIETLMGQYRWTQAAAQIDSLLKVFPHSEKPRQMPSRLRERKDMRKGELLFEWDKAVQAKDTDKSLAILKELDMYLTPAEALALQESASSVFKTKLHNLGVQFTMAITEKNWDSAVETGRQIMQDFPNSRMAAEIRDKMDILQDHARRSGEPRPATI